MALPAIDTFTTGSTQGLSTYNSDWTESIGSMVVEETQDAVFGSTGSGVAYAYWNADSFDDDQYSEAVVDIGSGVVAVENAVACRVHASAETAYIYNRIATSASTALWKVDAGGYTQLGNAGSSWSGSDTVRIEAESTTITPKINGSTDAAIGAQTDGVIGSGSAGLFAYGTYSVAANDQNFESWEGGNLAAADPAPSVSDNLTVSDSSTLAVSDPTFSVSDSLTVTDSSSLAVSDPSFSVSDNLTVTDDPTVSIQSSSDTILVNISRSANYIQVVTP